MGNREAKRISIPNLAEPMHKIELVITALHGIADSIESGAYSEKETAQAVRCVCGALDAHRDKLTEMLFF